MLKQLSLALALIMITATPAPAGTQNITRDMVARNYERLEQALNNRGAFQDMVKALHEHIGDDARFKVTVSNPVSGGQKSPVMELSKQDYINTYIQGTHYVVDYSVELETAAFQYDPQTDQAYTMDVMIERGTMMTQRFDSGKPFISRTTCRTKHELQGEKLVATAGECHTAISFEESI